MEKKCILSLSRNCKFLSPSLTPFPMLSIPSYWRCSQNILPFCMREVWVITACMDLINATASRYSEGLAASDVEKEFYRLQGDLYSLCRVKVIYILKLELSC